MSPQAPSGPKRRAGACGCLAHMLTLRLINSIKRPLGDALCPLNRLIELWRLLYPQRVIDPRGDNL
jgi:hypothetical protein